MLVDIARADEAKSDGVILRNCMGILLGCGLQLRELSPYSTCITIIRGEYDLRIILKSYYPNWTFFDSGSQY